MLQVYGPVVLAYLQLVPGLEVLDSATRCQVPHTHRLVLTGLCNSHLPRYPGQICYQVTWNVHGGHWLAHIHIPKTHRIVPGPRTQELRMSYTHTRTHTKTHTHTHTHMHKDTHTQLCTTSGPEQQIRRSCYISYIPNTMENFISIRMSVTLEINKLNSCS